MAHPKFRVLLERVAWRRFDAPMFVRLWCAERLENGGHRVRVRRLELFEFIRCRRGVRFVEIAHDLGDRYPEACGLSRGRTNGPGRMLYRDLKALLDRGLIERAERGLFVAMKDLRK